VDKLEERMVLM